MTTIEEGLRRLGEIKTAIQEGFRRVHGALVEQDAAARTLVGGASRMVGLTNSVVLLLRYGRAPQARPLLWSMMETSLAMCWAVTQGVEADDVSAQDLAGLLPADGGGRLQMMGITDVEFRELEIRLKGEPRLSHEAMGAPLEPTAAQMPEDALQLALRAMGAALWALGSRWPAEFPGAPASPKGTQGG